MYEDPDARDSLLDEYGVNYIVIGPWELGSYQISDYDTLASSYEIGLQPGQHCHPGCK